MCNIQPKEKTPAERALGLMGLAVRAGRVIFGTPMVCDAMRAGKKIWLVAEAKDSSENTHKRITDRCAYYGVTHTRLDVGTEALAHALGKSGDLAVVAITDRGMAQSILNLLCPSQGDPS